MGIKQSREDSEPILKLLRQVSIPIFKSAKTKLHDLSRNKCKMYVTKWELLLILQMNARDIKSIGQFINGEPDPLQIDINTLFLLLILTNSHIEYVEKLHQFVKFVINENGEDGYAAAVTLDEFRYIFQIAYQLLNRITDLDLIGKPLVRGDQDSEQQFGCPSEQLLLDKVFGKEGPSRLIEAPYGVVVGQMCGDPDIQKFFQIFQSGKVSATIPMQPSIALNLAENAPGSTEGGEPMVDQKGAPGTKSPSPPEIDASQTKVDISSNSPVAKSVLQDQIRTFSNASQSKQFQKGSMRVSNNNTGLQLSTQQTFSDIDQKNDCVWGVQITQRSPYSLEKMSKRILELKNENQSILLLHDNSVNFQKIQNNLEMLINKNLEFYAQRQTLQFMRSLIAQKRAAEIPLGTGSKILQGIMNEKQNSSNAFYTMDNAVYAVKKCLRNSFDEYLQQSYAQLKYEYSCAKSQLLYFIAEGGQRGLKRSLEQKKFKLLGQIQTLRYMFSQFIEACENNSEMDHIQGDILYHNIYLKMHELYESNIDHDFLINFINLKNQKRESKRFINFLQGAQTEMDLVLTNDYLNYDSALVGIPSIYRDAKSMIDNKLQFQINNAHILLMKKYSFNKIKLINYFTNLGKLKAFFKIQQVSKLSRDEITQMFTQQIKSLRIKLENVDAKLIQLLATHQKKQQVFKQFFKAYGQLSVIKCGINGLDFHYIFDYFALATIKQRTNESIWHLNDIKNQKDEKMYDDSMTPGAGGTGLLMPKLTGENIASLLKLQQIKIFDSFDNVGHFDSVDSGLNYKKFLDFTQGYSELYFKQSTSFGVTPTPIDQKASQRTQNTTNPDYITQTARQNLLGIYKQLGLLEKFKTIQKFQDVGPLKKQIYSLEYPTIKTKSYLNLLKEFDSLDHFIFDFIPFTGRDETHKDDIKAQKSPNPFDPEVEDQKVLKCMQSVSTSFSQISIDKIRQSMFTDKKVGYKMASEYLASLSSFDEMEFDQQFKAQRDAVFVAGIQVLFKMNKKNFINGINLKYMSISVEHSMQNNYWAYQTLKMFINEQMKGKIITDVSQISCANEINLMSLAQQAAVNQDQGQDVVNITGQGGGSTGFSVKTHSGTKKANQTYGEIFTLINNTENYEKRGKQSLIRQLMFQLDHMDNNIYNTQITIMEETKSDYQRFDKDMYKVANALKNKMARYIDERILIETYEQYERAFNNYDKTNNAKQLDSMLTGAIKYIGSLQNLLSKEMTDSEMGHKSKLLTQFLGKLSRDIINVQNGISLKNNKILTEILKEKDQGKKKEPKSATGRGAQLGSPQNRSTSPEKKKPVGDILEMELKELEQAIISQMIQIQICQEIIIGTKQYKEGEEFYAQLNKKIHLIKAKRERVKVLFKYCQFVCGINDKSATTPELLLIQENQSRGASIMNATLSGNIFNQFDIYNTNPSPDEFNQKSGYTSAQRGLNYLINFLQQICLQEDKLSSKRILNNSALFQFVQLSYIGFVEMTSQLTHSHNIQHALVDQVNIYEIQATPIKKYLQSYERQSMFMKKDIFVMLNKSGEMVLQAKFNQIICNKISSLSKSLINKIDQIFQEAILDDAEKTDFSNSQTKIRRSLDQDLRSYKEHLDVESNKNLTEAYESAQKCQEIKFSQSVTALQLLVRIYYLKQIQQQEDFTYSLELQKNNRLTTFQNELSQGDGKLDQTTKTLN